MQQGTRAGMKEVAQSAGVSVATVSHVVNHTGRVSQATQRRVQQVIDDLGYIHNQTARELKRGRSNTIGVIVLDIANPYFTELARGLEDRLAVDDCTLMLCSSDGDAHREASLMRQLVERGVRGILITPCEATVQNLALLRRVNCPVVLMDSRNVASGVATVGLDDIAGGRVAINHLIERGHRNIGLINGSHRLPHCQARWQGAMEAVAAEPTARVTELIAAGPTSADAKEATSRLLDTHPKTTAVFCYNDLAALGAMTACHQAGRSIPDDIAIVGFDDIQFAEQLSVPLTSVRQPMRAMGWEAAEILLTTSTETPHIVFQPELIIRQST